MISYKYLLAAVLLAGPFIFAQQVKQVRVFDSPEDSAAYYQALRKRTEHYRGIKTLAADQLKEVKEQLKRRDNYRYVQQITPGKDAIPYEEAINHPHPEDIKNIAFVDYPKRRLPRLRRFKNLEKVEIIRGKLTVIPWRFYFQHPLDKISIYNTASEKKIRMHRWGLGAKNIDISYCSPESVPQKFNKHKEYLQKLTLQNNQLTEMNLAIDKCSKLAYLHVRDNAYKPTAPIRFRGSSHLKELFAGGTSCEEFPEWILAFDSLRNANFSQSPMEHIPGFISELDQLEDLSFYEGNLQTIDPALGQLKKLKLLDLYYNQLTEVPDFFAGLDSLEILYVSYNQITRITDKIGQLSKLEELYAHHNKLTYLPETLANLNQLRVLRVNNNYFTAFPKVITELHSLEELDIGFNDFETLPSEITGLDQLYLLSMKGLNLDSKFSKNNDYQEIIETFKERGVRLLYESGDNN